MRASGVALLEVLKQVLRRAVGRSGGQVAELPELLALLEQPREDLAGHGHPEIRNSRGIVTGELRPAGLLRFYDG